TMKVPMPSYYYNLGEAGVIAFIQDNATREVWQSARSTPKALVGYGDAELQTVSDALPSVCARSIEPFAEVRNAGNTQITDLVIEYTLDSEDPVVENWTGTLEPGDKIRFTFDEVMLGDDPRSLNFEITSVNGKADYNPSNISQFSASIASIPEAANPGPAELGVEDKSVGEYPSGVAAVPPVPAGVDGFGTFTVVGPSWTFAGGDKMGAYGDSDNSIWINFFDWNPADANAKDEATLTFHKVDMTDLTDSYFRFDRAGARLTGLSRDEIIIEASTDCGATWQEIEKLRGRDLATVSNTNNRFVPSDRDWVTDEFSLEDYDGVSELIIQIRAISDWGNNNFLDNIVIGGKLPTGTKEINLLDGKVEIFPNPTNNVANIQFELEAATDVDIDIYDVTGKLIETLASKRAFPAGTHTMIWDGAENSGLYTVKIRTEIGEITKKVTVF
ncbi:MAG: T9SS type A sorting domain-containing protein, partial [Bacteroidota bacterium]